MNIDLDLENLGGSSTDSSPTMSDYFDQVIGCIENLVLDDGFQSIVNHFLETHYWKFDNEEENKIEYMEIYQMYTEAIERFIVEKLNERMTYFDMERFAMELEWVNNNSESRGDFSVNDFVFEGNEKIH